MIYLDITPEQCAERYEIPLYRNCTWCGRQTQGDRAFRTKDSVGMEYRCVCRAEDPEYVITPVTEEAKRFWAEVMS